jgi:hypothetical protein
MVLNDIERTVINLKSIISEYYYEYLDIFGEIAASQLPLRQSYDYVIDLKLEEQLS